LRSIFSTRTRGGTPVPLGAVAPTISFEKPYSWVRMPKLPRNFASSPPRRFVSSRSGVAPAPAACLGVETVPFFSPALHSSRSRCLQIVFSTLVPLFELHCGPSLLPCPQVVSPDPRGTTSRLWRVPAASTSQGLRGLFRSPGICTSLWPTTTSKWRAKLWSQGRVLVLSLDPHFFFFRSATLSGPHGTMVFLANSFNVLSTFPALRW